MGSTSCSTNHCLTGYLDLELLRAKEAREGYCHEDWTKGCSKY
jgi:hypothetical protein